jgi:hypothetical protein
MIPPTWMIEELRRRERERERQEQPQLRIELEVPARDDRDPKPERRPGDAIVIEY